MFRIFIFQKKISSKINILKFEKKTLVNCVIWSFKNILRLNNLLFLKQISQMELRKKND